MTDLSGLLVVMTEMRRLVALPDNDFAWSAWRDHQAALADMDRSIAALTQGAVPDCVVVCADRATARGQPQEWMGSGVPRVSGPLRRGDDAPHLTRQSTRPRPDPCRRAVRHSHASAGSLHRPRCPCLGLRRPAAPRATMPLTAGAPVGCLAWHPAGPDALRAAATHGGGLRDAHAPVTPGLSPRAHTPHPAGGTRLGAGITRLRERPPDLGRRGRGGLRGPHRDPALRHARGP